MECLPKIETERLILDELTAADIPYIVSYASNISISAHTLNIPHPYAEKDAIYWINLSIQGLKNKTNFIFAIRLKTSGEFIGGIGLTVDQKFSRAEVGYWIAQSFWNNGYTTEAAKSIIQFGFDKLSLNKITSSHFEKNPASGRVMVKCKMTKEGELKEHIHKNGLFHTLFLYGLTKSEYKTIISTAR
ncbi:GNAT family N-acetyltransferase [Anditalea andensis]|uniref:GNAT family acetyltransferase n=1 Tax=Anditalea andensis TaxID=1048983 RepID=A0A074LFV9_9BACT|nr:GNAT family protein [Anditalea andensis]KEO72662.1 GNAT family acetyltransferase [Anditalea andensis]